MTNEELINKMRDPAVNRECLAEMLKVLQEEMDKPFEEQDQDLINDLIQTITEMTGMSDTIQEHAEAGIARMRNYTEKISGKRRVIRVRWLIPIAFALILLTSNVLSYSVFGMNAFSAAVQITKGGIIINYNDLDLNSESQENPYAEEILAVCEENGFTPLVPHYLPSELKPSETWKDITELELTRSLFFYLVYKQKKLNIDYTYMMDSSSDINFGIPTQTYNLSEELICGITVYILREGDTEFNISFRKEQIVYSLYADGYDETEVRKILYSMFE